MTVDEAFKLITTTVGYETYPYSITELEHSIVFDYRNYNRILVTVTDSNNIYIDPQIFIGLSWETISINKDCSLREWLSWLY